MVKILTGGGYGSRNVSKVYEPKTEPKPHAQSPAGVAQQGMAVQFPKEELRQGPGYRGGPEQSTGIANAKYNAATSGPGSLRTTYPSGSQSPTPLSSWMALAPRPSSDCAGTTAPT